MFDVSDAKKPTRIGDVLNTGCFPETSLEFRYSCSDSRVFKGLRLVLPAAIFLVLAFALPILGIVGRSLFDPDLTLKNYAEVLRAPSTVKVFLNTFRIALEVTVVTAVLGYLLAYGMARARGRWAAVMLGAVMLPLWTSDLVRTFSWRASHATPSNQAKLSTAGVG